MFKYLIIGGVVFYLLNNFGLTIETVNPTVNEILNLPVQIRLKDLLKSDKKNQNKLINIYFSKINNKKVNANFIR